MSKVKVDLLDYDVQEEVVKDEGEKRVFITILRRGKPMVRSSILMAVKLTHGDWKEVKYNKGSPRTAVNIRVESYWRRIHEGEFEKLKEASKK